MTIRAYCRVSTEDQKLDSQKVPVDKWLKSQDDQAVVWYSDEGYSRLTTAGRPGWAKLMKEIEGGDLVVFPQLDRAVADLGEYLAIRKELRARKVGYWYVRENMGWKPGEEPNPFTEALEETLAVFYKLETKIRRKRQIDGIKAAKKKVQTGERTHWFKNSVQEDGSLVIERKPKKLDEKTVEAIKTLKAQGTKIAVIGRMLKMTPKTVYAALAM